MLAAGAKQKSADVSLTARSFFEAHGFTAEAEQHPGMGGVQMANFHVVKQANTRTGQYQGVAYRGA